MAVLDEVVDEQFDAAVVVEDHAAFAAADDRAVEEHARHPSAGHVLEPLAAEPDGRDEQPVDAVGEQRLQRFDFAFGGLLAVHQQCPIAGVMQRRSARP